MHARLQVVRVPQRDGGRLDHELARLVVPRQRAVGFDDARDDAGEEDAAAWRLKRVR